MAKTLQFRRGTTSELSSQTGAEGEIFIDTTKDTVVVMDGNTAGGKPLATEEFVLANSGSAGGDAVFDSALIGDVSIVGNTIAGVDSYGNADTLIVDGEMQVKVGDLSVFTGNSTSNNLQLDLYSYDVSFGPQNSGYFNEDFVRALYNNNPDSSPVVSITLNGNGYTDFVIAGRLTPNFGWSAGTWGFNNNPSMINKIYFNTAFLNEITVNGNPLTNIGGFNSTVVWGNQATFTTGSIVTPLAVTETGVNVEGTFTVNGEPVGGSSGSSYDQDLNTTDDVVFDSALISNVSIVANTISAINSYGNSDSLILSGSAVNIIPESTTVTTTTAEWVNTSDALFTGTNVNIADSPGGDIIGFYTINDQEFYNSLLALPIGTIITVAQPSGNTTVTLASQFIEQGGGNLGGMYANVVSLPVSGYSQGEVSGVTTNILTSTTETATFAFDPAGTFSTTSLLADSALIGDVSISGSTISGVDSYGLSDTLVVDGDLEVTGSLINDSTLTVNQDGSKSVVVDTTATTTITLDMSGYGTLQWSLNNNDGRYYFLIPTSLYEIYSEYFIAGTVVTGFLDAAGKAGPFTLTLDTNMVSMQLGSSSGYGAKTVGNPPGFPPNSTNNIWPNEVTVTNLSGSIANYSFDDQGAFSTTSLLADSALIGDVSIAGNTIAAVDSYGLPDTLVVDGDLQITGNLTLPTNATAPSNTLTVVLWAKIVVDGQTYFTPLYQ